MATFSEDFIHQFHSLKGTTIGQRRKYFFLILHQNSSLKSNKDLLDVIVANLNPTTFLEELFKVEFLIYFRRKKELFQLLKNGNDVFINKIMKQKWFFQELFEEIDIEELVNDVLPSMSYSVRMKLLKKLSKLQNPDRFDKIYDAVQARYGIFIASKFFLGCSAEKFKRIFKEKPVQLSTNQLKFVYQKNPDLIEFYFENCSFQTSHNSEFLKHMYSENRNLYNRLKENLGFELILGRRLTKKVFDERRHEIITTPRSFIEYLHMNTLIRKLGNSYTQLFCNLLPSEFDHMTTLYWIQYFPKKYHHDLMFKIVQNHYNMKFIEHPDLIDETLLNLEPDGEKRAVLAKIKVDEGENKFIKYLTADEAISLLKDKINVKSDITERGVLVKYLIETCEINKDISKLAEVMKYFGGRHKSDDVVTVGEFLSDLENSFDFREFTEDMWNTYYEILVIYTLKHDTDEVTYEKIQTKPLSKYFLSESRHQQLSYLNFLFQKNQNIDEYIEEFFSDGPVYPAWGLYDKNFEKYIFMYIINEAAKKELSSYNIQSSYYRIFEEINSWNRSYPDDTLNFRSFPFLVDSFYYVLNNFKEIGSVILDIFRSSIFTTNQNLFKKEYLEIYWKRWTVFGRLSDFKWFLKHDPIIIEKHFDIFLEAMVKKSFRQNRQNYCCGASVWYEIKKFSHLHLDQRSIQHYLTKINDKNCKEHKSNFIGIECLSLLMKPEEYATFADSYKPVFNGEDKKQPELYKLRCAIAKNLKNTKTYSVLPSLLNYSDVIYLKYSLNSLYSILYKTPESMISQHLNHLAEKDVYLRKHTMYLTCELGTVKQVEYILKLLSNTEHMPSLQIYVFSSTLKYFLKNPLDQFFEIVKTTLPFVTENDYKLQKLIVKNCRNIPIKYQIEYIQLSWEHLEKTIKRPRWLAECETNLLEAIICSQEVIERLPTDFGMKIIWNNFHINTRSSRLRNISYFTSNFLCSREDNGFVLNTLLEMFVKWGYDEEIVDLFESIFCHFSQTLSTKCRVDYLQQCWEHFEKTMQKSLDLKKMKKELLIWMTSPEIAKELPFEFGIKIIQEHFFQNDSWHHQFNVIDTFTFYFLFHRNEKSQILNTVLHIVDHQRSYCKFRLIDIWYNLIMKCTEIDDLKFLKPFVDYFEKKIDLVEDFNNYIRLSFINMKIESSSDSSDDFAKMFFIFFQNLIRVYGPYVVEMFSSEVNRLISEEERNALCLNLMQNYANRDVAILVLQILCCYKEEKYLNTFNTVISLIKSMPDPAVQIVLYSDYRHLLS